MKIEIDNLDGSGSFDYANALDGTAPFRISRLFNEPTTCTFSLNLNGSNLPVPSRHARVKITTDYGLVIFTGYVAFDPVNKYLGEANEGPVRTLDLKSESDDLLLDEQSLLRGQLSVGNALNNLIDSVTSQDLIASKNISSESSSTGRVVIHPGDKWSDTAARLSSVVRASYRVVDGQLQVTPVGSVSHVIRSSNCNRFENVARNPTEVNDIFLIGDVEAATIYCDVFTGDGVTTKFVLTDTPTLPSANSRMSIQEEFGNGTLSSGDWVISDAGSHFSEDGSGLKLSGGNGVDGQSYIAYQAPI